MLPLMKRNNNWIPSVFNDFFDTDFMPRLNATAPAINVVENEKDYQIELAAPGMRKEDFQIHINKEGNLSIKMESKKENEQKENKGRYLRREFSYSKFEQTLVLPEDIEKDKISAKVTDGVLRIILPKTEATISDPARQIDIEE